MRTRSRVWVAYVVLAMAISSACGDSGTDPALGAEATTTSTTPAIVPTTTTAEPPAPTEAPSIAALPNEGEPWDLLFLGFEEALTRLPGELLAGELTDALGVEVRLYEPAGFDHVYAATLVGQLRGDRYPPLMEFVTPAEVIMMVSRPGGADANDQIEADFEKCHWSPLNGEPPVTDLTDAYWTPFRETLDDVYAEMWTLREDHPTVLIALDMPNAQLTAQQEGGIAAECIAWYGSLSEQIAQAAAANGAISVSVLAIFNGENHDIDSVTAGLTGPSDFDPGAPIWRSTPQGATLLADALASATQEALNQR